jgi:hypothetical protein
LSADLVTLGPACPPSARPERLFDPTSGVHGLRAARTRLAAPDRIVEVWLYQDPPAGIDDPAAWGLVPPPGGAPVAIDAAAIVAAPTPHVELTLAGRPDAARYRLEIDPPTGIEFDPLRTWLGVRLRPECPDLGSCFEPAEAPPPAAPSPVQSYLGRDWAGLRRELVEELLRRDPGADLSVADPAITLIELMAHAGDLLAYRQDRVATEAYLETARLRTSVRRHARLVDFAVGDGQAARTFVHVVVAPEAPPVAVQAGSVAVDSPESHLAFALEDDLTADPALGEIPIYDWGEEACWLRPGGTECVLVRPLPADPLGDAWLAPGDLIAFEVVDPGDEDVHRDWSRRVRAWPAETATGDPALREPLASRRAQVVQLTEVSPFADPLLGAGLSLYRVRWRAEDALARAYSVGIDTSQGAPEVTVVRGNLVPAHHGRLVDGPAGETLAQRVPSWADPATAAPAEFSLVAAGSPAGPRGPGPGLATGPDGPYGLAVRVTLPSGVTVGAQHVGNLLDARPGELSVVVDVEEHEPPILRFATGAVGLSPPLGSTVTAAYEVGGGSPGNVAAGALTVLERNTAPAGQVPTWQVVAGVTVRNPAPASGGADPTPLDVVRRDAPEAFAAEPRRAVLPADHAAAALDLDEVQRAMAHRAWSGSWPVVGTVVDLEVEGDEAVAQTTARLQGILDDLRMLGTEVAVVPGTPVGLFIALDVCAMPTVEAEQLRRDILELLHPGSEERPGVFNPSRLQLGAAVYLSAVVAAVSAVPGVDAVQVREARRLSDPAGTVRDVIPFAPDEVGVLDDDPARPDRGRLDVNVRGGR